MLTPCQRQTVAGSEPVDLHDTQDVAGQGRRIHIADLGLRRRVPL